MSPRFTLFLGFLAVVVIVVSMSAFTVNEKEQAVKFRFGEIIKTDFQPGLHWKIPIVNNVRKFEDRILTLDNRPERFLTGEVKYVLVDFFVKWRIADVAKFYTATAGNEATAGARLLAIITNGMKEEFARRTIKEVVSAERSELMDNLVVAADREGEALGIDVIDVRVKRVDLPEDVSDSVYDRMREERRRTANLFRSEGMQTAEEIRAQAERERTVILAEAYRDAEKIRGEGDATSAEIYADAYKKNPEFYAFYRSMEAYRKSLGKENDVLVLEPGDSDFFRYLNKPSQ